MDKITPTNLREMKRRREPISALTCYDAATASLLDEAGVAVALVGDSLGNVKLGYENTLPVSLREMIHYTRAASRGNSKALLVADMPFLSYEISPEEAARNAGLLVKEGGAEAVKLEGGRRSLPAVRAILAANIPVMGHIGLTPQSIHRLGGYRVQGRSPREARELFADARALDRAGVFAIVLELLPRNLARRITRAVSAPTIGIGAGPFCDGQILVVDDLLGLTPGRRPRFVKAYAELRRDSLRAIRQWKNDVRTRRYPDAAHSYD